MTLASGAFGFVGQPLRPNLMFIVGVFALGPVLWWIRTLHIQIRRSRDHFLHVGFLSPPVSAQCPTELQLMWSVRFQRCLRWRLGCVIRSVTAPWCHHFHFEKRPLPPPPLPPPARVTGTKCPVANPQRGSHTRQPSLSPHAGKCVCFAIVLLGSAP